MTFESFNLQGKEATALHEAAEKGFAEVVKILVESGASVQDEDKVRTVVRTFFMEYYLIFCSIRYSIQLY